MRSKEKAKELINKFGSKIHFTDRAEPKQMALICVDEIIKSLYKLPSLNDIVDSRQAGGYWEEVKQEIKKLQP